MYSCPSSFLVCAFSTCPLTAWNVLPQTVTWWRLYSCSSSAQMLPPPGSLLWLHQLYYIASPNSFSIVLLYDHLFTALFTAWNCHAHFLSSLSHSCWDPSSMPTGSVCVPCFHSPGACRWTPKEGLTVGEKSEPTVIMREKPRVLGDFREGERLIEEQNFFMKIQIMPTGHHRVTKVWASPIVLCVLVRTGIMRSFLQMWVEPACYFRVLAAAMWAVLGSCFMHSWFRTERQSHLYIKGKKTLKCSPVYCLPKEPWVLTTCQIRACAKKT